MKRKDVEKKAMEYFQSGLCCSEAVFKTLIEISDQEDKDDIIKIASGFCGGIGSTHNDICGALSGGIMGLGYLYGRNKPNESHQKAKDLAAETLKSFEERFGATQCSALLELLGEQTNGEKCCSLSGEAAGMLYELIENN